MQDPCHVHRSSLAHFLLLDFSLHDEPGVAPLVGGFVGELDGSGSDKSPIITQISLDSSYAHAASLLHCRLDLVLQLIGLTSKSLNLCNGE
jgi:hypothetical protein